MAHTDTEEAYRAARRRVVRDLHPDRGGDAAAFVAALAELERSRAPRVSVPRAPVSRVHVAARRHVRLRRGAAAGQRLVTAARARLPRGWPGARRYIQL